MFKKEIKTLMLVLFSTAAISQVDLNSGLVAHYPFNGNANDESGNNFHAVSVNATLSTDRFGNEDKAYYLDGAENAIDFGDILNDVFITNTFSISVWFKAENYINGNERSGMLVSKWNSSNQPQNSFILYGSNLRFITGGKTSGIPDFDVPETGTWNMLTVSVDNGVASIYLNAELQGVVSDHNCHASTYSLLFGNHQNPVYGFHGSIDDVRIYDRPLSGDEVDYLYNINFNEDLVAHYPFNGNANDESGNGHHGTLHGPQLENDRYGTPNSAYNFNGTSDYIQLPNIIPPFEGSVSYWFKTHSISQEQILVYHSNLNSDGFGIGSGSTYIENHTAITASGYNYFIFDNGHGSPAIDSLVPIIEDTWYHVVLTYDAPNFASMYVNGEMVYTRDLSAETATNLPDRTYIGRPGASTRYFNGVFDELRIYDRVLSEEEVDYLYNINLDEGLIAYYPFTGNADNEVSDEFHGIPQNSPALTNDRLGIEEQAYNFNSTDQYIAFDSANPIITTATFTISAWARMDGVGGGNNSQNTIFTQRASDTGTTSAIGLTADAATGETSFAVRGHGSESDRVAVPVRDFGQWHHYLGVVDSDSVKLYINGELADAIERTTSNNFAENIHTIAIGRHHHSGYTSGLFNGDIDEVRIYNRPLNNQEVQALYYETLRAEFVADKSDSFAPLTVGFEDQSFSEMDITSWQWDFTGDGIIDSEEQNPEFTFEVGGEYNVKLIIGDGTHTDSIIMNNLITVYDLNNGLTRHYKFDGDALDSSVNELHGEAYGAEVTDRYGIPESAYAFNGENNVTVPSIASWGEQLSISFWFYAEANSSNQILFGSRAGSSGATKINMRSFLLDDGTVTFQVASDDSNNTDVISDNTAELFAWNHVICELDLVNNTETIILNGVETTKTYDYVPRFLDQGIGFGNWKEPFASTSGLAGKIDEVRFYDRVLFQEEKDELLVNDFPMADYFGAMAIYPFSGNANDVTGNGNDGDVNNAELTYDRYRKSTSAYNFPSEESYIDIGPDLKPESFPIYITAWINPTETEGVNTIVATDVWEVEGVLSGTIAQIIDGQIYAAFGIWDGAETSLLRAKITTELEFSIPTNEWTHIAVGFHSSDDIRIYVNGEIVDGNYEGDATEIGYTDYGFGHIGNNQNLSTHFKGDIDEVYIFDRYVYNWEIVEMANEPGMSASTDQMAFHEVEAGEVSVEQVFSVYGLNLLGYINIKAPQGFTVSLTTGSGFSSEITVAEEDGLIDITPIFVRFEPTSDNEYSGNITISSEGLNDINISMTGNPETINVNTPEKDNIQIYPNPFNDIVSISNAKDIKRIVVSNIIGQRIIDMGVENNDFVMINTGELTKGIYVITLIDSNGVRKTEKMIKN